MAAPSPLKTITAATWSRPKPGSDRSASVTDAALSVGTVQAARGIGQGEGAVLEGAVRGGRPLRRLASAWPVVGAQAGGQRRR